MKKLSVLSLILLVLAVALPSFAAQLRVFVSDMNAVGVQNKDEMKMTLQTLLASRLTRDRIVAVGSAVDADAVISGTYVVVGKIFSVDAVAKAANGQVLARSFVQGENQDELIPALGKLADKLSAELDKIYFSGSSPTGAPPLTPLPASTPSPDVVRPLQSNIRTAQTGDIIRPQEYIKGSSGGWISKRLPGAANLLAIGSTLSGGNREIFLAQDTRLQYFRMGEELKLVASIDIKPNEKIISLDVVDGDGDGNKEIYVTIVRSEELASQIWEVKGDKLNRLATDLPYYFRAMGLAGGAKKLYAQEMGREDDYFGDVFEATRSGAKITFKNPVKMPRYGTIYTFNQFRDKDGTVLTVVINPDSYLIVYGPDRKEIWRSNDKFGGSALYFQKDDQVNVRTTGERLRWLFMNQRIIVTAKNDILVGKNDGFFVIGNARSYKKGSVYCLFWDGSSMEEKWRTKETQNYMPDYWFDEARNELLILQMPQKPGIGEDGASSLAIKKVE